MTPAPSRAAIDYRDAESPAARFSLIAGKLVLTTQCSRNALRQNSGCNASAPASGSARMARATPNGQSASV